MCRQYLMDRRSRQSRDSNKDVPSLCAVAKKHPHHSPLALLGCSQAPLLRSAFIRNLVVKEAFLAVYSVRHAFIAWPEQESLSRLKPRFSAAWERVVAVVWVVPPRFSSLNNWTFPESMIYREISMISLSKKKLPLEIEIPCLLLFLNWNRNSQNSPKRMNP